MANELLFTIGHSTHSIERFISLLKQHEISALADVRSSPYSRYNPQFNKQALENSLRESGIAYVFLGKELGARSEDPSCYENGRVVYGRLARTALFRTGLDRLKKGAADHKVALMCAEKEPLDCHRTILVSRALDAEGMPISHIHADGTLELHRKAMERLLGIVGLPPSDLFKSPAELMDEAFAKQEARIAFVDEQMEKEPTGAAS
jgi:uncharacterized protein (DUF488 family)